MRLHDRKEVVSKWAPSSLRRKAGSQRRLWLLTRRHWIPAPYRVQGGLCAGMTGPPHIGYEISLKGKGGLRNPSLPEPTTRLERQCLSLYCFTASRCCPPDTPCLSCEWTPSA